MQQNSIISLTIITPTHNRADRSNSQIFKNWTAIQNAAQSNDITATLCIVDDGSTDDTYTQLIAQFGDQANIEILQHKTNQGPGLARQTGLKNSKGKWVWFLDDDDDLNETALTSLFEALRHCSDETDLIAHSLQKDYSRLKPSRLGKHLARNIIWCREKQEVFNFIYTRDLLDQNEIAFSNGVHEDIRYVAEACSVAQSVKWVDAKIVLKNTSEDSITLGLSNRRIAGYLQAYEEIDASPLINNPDTLIIQYIGLILYLISKETAPDKATAYLQYLQAQLAATDRLEQTSQIAAEYSEKNTNFEYATHIFFVHIADLGNDTLAAIKAVFATHITCQDLQSSLFLGPDEIRACCKRFFVDGKQKGDVVLLKAAPDITYDDIQNAKADLVTRMNNGTAPECSGCPYIDRRAPKPDKISYISLENFSYCNMRCTYCSPTYYGGQEASYSTPDILANLLEQSDNLSSYCHVVWGGGEPTLSPNFKPVNALLSTNENVGKIRVLSNSLKYSKSLVEYLEHDKFHLVTSIDAGTQDMFAQIRGRGKMQSVLENLQKYKTTLPNKNRLTIKYILTPENLGTEELQAYVDQLKQSELTDCLFQISCDFRLTAGDQRLLNAMYELSTRLFMAGAEYVFFDDHIRDRCTMDTQKLDTVLQYLTHLTPNTSHLITHKHDSQIVLWGLGRQSEWMLENSTAGQQGIIAGVARNADDWDAICQQHGKQLPILPAGVQSMFEIVENIKSAKLDQHIIRAVLA